MQEDKQENPDQQETKKVFKSFKIASNRLAKFYNHANNIKTKKFGRYDAYKDLITLCYIYLSENPELSTLELIDQ